jgi:hypothetical protein
MLSDLITNLGGLLLLALAMTFFLIYLRRCTA